MKTETPPPTIAELWGRLQFKSAQASDREKYAVMYPEKADNWRAFAQKARDEYAPIRQLLVDRCASVSDREGCYTDFVIRGNTLKAVIYLPNNSRFSGSRKYDANSAREMSASYAFWAWELQQREKELQNGK